MELNMLLHLVLRLRMSRTLPPLPMVLKNRNNIAFIFNRKEF
jgi:hypothetical protein